MSLNITIFPSRVENHVDKLVYVFHGFIFFIVRNYSVKLPPISKKLLIKKEINIPFQILEFCELKLLDCNFQRLLLLF